MKYLTKTLLVLILLVSSFSFAQAQCQAGYIYLISGSQVQFSDSSNGTSGPITYYWDFGNGDTAVVANPITTMANGTYYVCLTISDSVCSDTYCDSVLVGNPPPSCGTPNFSYIDNTDGSASFINSSSNASNYLWDFGNGNISTLVGPSFFFQPAGTYYVCLTINDSCNNIFCDSITVTDTAGSVCDGSANFTFTDNGGGNISFSNNSTLPTSYYWDFGDGLGSSTSAAPNYIYTTDGNYQVVLTIIDSTLQCTTSTNQLLVVSGASNICSMANFISTDNGSGNLAFSSTSTGQPTAYSWNFGDGTQGIGQFPNHTYNADGIYVVALTVFDSVLGCSNSTNNVLSVTGTVGSAVCNAAFVVTYDSLLSSLMVFNTSTGNNLNYYWEFGDGNTSSLENPNYTYGGNGPYELCITVDDGVNCTSIYCDSIFAGGTVLKQLGFSIAISRPTITSITEYGSVFSELNVYPNPVKDELTIDFMMGKIKEIEIYVTDVLGNVVANVVNQEMVNGKNQIKWNTIILKNGIYLLNIRTNNNNQVKKFVINR